MYLGNSAMINFLHFMGQLLNFVSAGLAAHLLLNFVSAGAAKFSAHKIKKMYYTSSRITEVHQNVNFYFIE